MKGISHSMRAGFITSALGRRVDPLLVMKTSRKKVDTLAIYDRQTMTSTVALQRLFSNQQSDRWAR
jgi:predicted solute-binding protein